MCESVAKQATPALPPTARSSPNTAVTTLGMGVVEMLQM